MQYINDLDQDIHTSSRQHKENKKNTLLPLSMVIGMVVIILFVTIYEASRNYKIRFIRSLITEYNIRTDRLPILIGDIDAGPFKETVLKNVRIGLDFPLHAESITISESSSDYNNGEFSVHAKNLSYALHRKPIAESANLTIRKHGPELSGITDFSISFKSNTLFNLRSEFSASESQELSRVLSEASLGRKISEKVVLDAVFSINVEKLMIHYFDNGLISNLLAELQATRNIAKEDAQMVLAHKLARMTGMPSDASLHFIKSPDNLRIMVDQTEEKRIAIGDLGRGDKPLKYHFLMVLSS